MTAPDQPKAPATQRVSLVDVYAGILDPLPGDDPLTPWEKRCRDLSLDLRDERQAVETARARIAELEAERHERRVMGEIAASVVIDRCDGLERDLAFWKERAEERIGWYQEQMARADRLATELAEAKAAGRKEGLREAAEIADDYVRAADARAAGAYHHDIARDAEKRKREGKRIADAIRARLSATGDWGCFVCERVVDPCDFSADAACPYCGRSDGLREMTIDDLDAEERHD